MYAGVQLSTKKMYLNFCYPSPLHSVADHRFVMLKLARIAMLRITNVRYPRKHWLTAIVLVAVCTLTVSVATRYSVSSGVADRAHASISKLQTWSPGVQRLLNDAATWIPPFVGVTVFHDTTRHPHVQPSHEIVSSVLLEEDLYNRPPPSFLSLS